MQRAYEQSRDDANVGWERHRIPHPPLSDFVDSETNVLFDALLADRILAIHRRLMAAKSAGLLSANLFKTTDTPAADSVRVGTIREPQCV